MSKPRWQWLTDFTFNAGFDVPCLVGDLPKAFGPVVTAPGENLNLVGEMDLHSIAIEFDFVYPAFAAGHILDRCREGGLDEGGEGHLHADGRRVPMLEGHAIPAA
jgi:hypothetical protein